MVTVVTKPRIRPSRGIQGNWHCYIPHPMNRMIHADNTVRGIGRSPAQAYKRFLELNNRTF